MKTILLSVLLLGIAVPVSAIEKAELDNHIHKLIGKFEALQTKSDKRIPAETLKKAHGIVLLDRTKAGFIFAFQGGGGVAMVKDAKGKWSPPAFLSATEASLGAQIGGQQSFIVILLMTTNATRILTDSEIEFGGEARGTAGNSTAGAEGNLSPERAVLIYDDRQGLYGGAAVKGGSLSVNDDANTAYYGQYVTLEDVLFKQKVKQTDTSTKLVEKIEGSAK